VPEGGDRDVDLSIPYAAWLRHSPPAHPIPESIAGCGCRSRPPSAGPCDHPIGAAANARPPPATRSTRP
jgi:hypothetical protein